MEKQRLEESEQRREEEKRPEKMQVREKVEKSRFTVTMFLVTWGLGAPDYFARVFLYFVHASTTIMLCYMKLWLMWFLWHGKVRPGPLWFIFIEVT